MRRLSMVRGAALLVVLAWAGCTGPASRCNSDADCDTRENHCQDGFCRPGPPASPSGSSSSPGVASSAAPSSSGESPSSSGEPPSSSGESPSSSGEPPSSSGESPSSSGESPSSSGEPPSSSGESPSSSGEPPSSSGESPSSSGESPSSSGEPASSSEPPSSGPPADAGPDAGPDAATDAGGAIPLSDLCPHLFTTLVRLGVAGEGSTAEALLCGALTTDEALLGSLGPTGDWLPVACGPAGAGTNMLSRVVASLDAGRMAYDPRAAWACGQEGRVTLALADTYPNRDVALAQLGMGGMGWPALPPSCRAMLRGTVPPGGTCHHELDCQTPDGGWPVCQGRGGGHCSGTCTVLHDPVACNALGSSLLKCPHGTQCTRGTCLPMAPPDAPCQDPDGGDLPCEPGLACLDGRCAPPSQVAGPCDHDGHCAYGLACASSDAGGLCVATLGLDEPCGWDGGLPCAPCLTCLDDDAGSRCRARFVVGSTCDTDTNPCPASLACVEQRCVRLARAGETCMLVDAVDDTLRGTCLDPAEACLPSGGSTRRCQRRAGLDGGCHAQPHTSRSLQGSCYRLCADPNSCNFLLATELGWVESTATCSRTASSASQGRCVGPARVGEICGNRHDLSPFCQTADGQEAQCTAQDAGLAGRCVHRQGGPTGGACITSEGCMEGLFCALPGDGGVGACQVAAALGQPCGEGQAWGTRCQEGACVDQGDGGQACVTTALGWGARCVDTWDCGATMRCAVPEGSTQGLCRNLGGPGDRCRENRDCDGTDLRCVASVCTPRACAPRSRGCLGVEARAVEDDFPLALPLLVMCGGVVAFRRRSRRSHQGFHATRGAGSARRGLSNFWTG